MKNFLKFILVVFIILSTNNQYFAQGVNIDSMETIIKTHTAKDSIRVNTLNKLSLTIYTKDLERSKKMAEEAVEIAETIQFQRGTAEGYRFIGIYWLLKSDYKKALDYMFKSLKIHTEISNKLGMGWAFNTIAIIYKKQGNFKVALDYYAKSISAFEEVHFKTGIASALNNIAVIYFTQKNYKEALNNLFKALVYEKEKNNQTGIARLYNNIAENYGELKELENAEKYYFMSMEISEKLNDKISLGFSYYGLATTYDRMKKLDKALEFHNKGLENRIATKNKYDISYSYNGFANHFRLQNNDAQAIEYANKALALGTEIGSPEVIKDAAEVLYNCYANRKQFVDAFKYKLLYDAEKDSIMNKENTRKLAQVEMQYEFDKKEKEQEIEQRKKDLENEKTLNRQKLISFLAFAFLAFIFAIAVIIFRSYKQKQKDNKLLTEQKEKITLQAQELELINKELEKLSIVASETDNAVIICDAKGNFEWVNLGFTRLYGYTLDEVKTKIGSNLFASSTNQKIENDKQTCLTNKQSVNYESFIVSKTGDKIWVQTTLTPILDENNNIKKIVAIDSDIRKMKQAEQEILQKNEEITVQKEALEQQNEEILAQRDELELMNAKIIGQNESIKSSIRYAQTIQQAILPNVDKLARFSDYFLIYRPKDIVSGDFYWFSEIASNIPATKPSILIAIVDCTGHGVPGAFMSMIGNRLLNEIVNENQIHLPSLILESLNDKIMLALKQNESDNNDGMDVCLCRFDNVNETQVRITFAGAKRPLFYRKENDAAISVIKGDIRTIGGVHKKVLQSFTNHEISLEKNDVLYLCTDGYIDQNDVSRKRFGTLNFLKLMKENRSLSMSAQSKLLKATIDNYQKGSEQRDDITVLGIKI